VLNIQKLSHSFRNGIEETMVLDRIDLHVAKQEVVALLGSSGSGKSTLLNLMAGLMKPTNGSIMIAGLSLTGSIQTDKKSGATVVPTLAVLHEQNDYFVYVERNGSVEKQSIKLGLETPEKTEVLEGIKAGDTIVLQ
jgi:ABC-type multidrug transport system ATPase subunit